MFFFSEPKDLEESKVLSYNEEVGNAFLKIFKECLESRYHNILLKIIGEDEDILEFYPYFNFYELEFNEINTLIQIVNCYFLDNENDKNKEIMLIWFDEILPNLKKLQKL